MRVWQEPGVDEETLSSIMTLRAIGLDLKVISRRGVSTAIVFPCAFRSFHSIGRLREVYERSETQRIGSILELFKFVLASRGGRRKRAGLEIDECYECVHAGTWEGGGGRWTRNAFAQREEQQNISS